MFQSAETLHSLETVCQILREINFGKDKDLNVAFLTHSRHFKKIREISGFA